MGKVHQSRLHLPEWRATRQACSAARRRVSKAAGLVRPEPRIGLEIHTVKRAVRTGSFRAARGVRWLNAAKGRFAAAVVRLLQSPAAFGIGGAPGGYPPPRLYGCGCSSGVEHDLAKVGVEGSNPFARSNT